MREGRRKERERERERERKRRVDELKLIRPFVMW